MMLSTHSNMAEEVQEWSRLRFAGCQAEVQAPDTSFPSTEQQDGAETPERRISTEEGIMQKRRMLEKRVSFPSDETMLVQNLEPTVPDVPGKIDFCLNPISLSITILCFAECILSEEPDGVNLVAAYTSSCKKNETEPVEHILEQLKVMSMNLFNCKCVI